MPSRRASIQMSPEDIRAYLRTQGRIVLVTNGADGMPHPMPMNFALDDEGRIVMTTFRKSQKVRNLARDPRATLLVESGVLYNEIKAVIIHANAEIIDDADHIRAYLRSLEWTVAQNPLSPETRQQAEGTFSKRVALRFTPFKYVSWDHSKLAGNY